MRLTGSDLSLDDVNRVAVLDEPVELDPTQLRMVDGANQRVRTWGREGHPIYGVNTGFGELVYMTVPAQYEAELQENLLRSHAAGGGPMFPDHVVRAIMLARLNCLMKGYSGASTAAVELLAAFLNRGIHPQIPEQGSLGASGDLAPLSHMALPLIGLGKVRLRGQLLTAAEVLATEGLKPIEPGYKEALALINGTSAMTGTAALAVVDAERLLRVALLTSAAFVQCMRGSTRPFEARGHALKNHAGQMAVAAAIRRLLDGSQLTREHEEIMQMIKQGSGDGTEVVDSSEYLQNAYTLRCIPQILGPVADTLSYVRRILEEELNSCNDNPLIFESPEQVFHGGHFHGQYVSMVSDFLNIAVTEIGVLAERQLNRLLDPYLNTGYPAFLASGEEGLFCGLEGMQYLATSLASENLDLAAPASIKTIPSNGQNQDVVSMGLIAARKSLRLNQHVDTILTLLVVACHQAGLMAGLEKFSPPVRALLEALAERAPLYRDDEAVVADHVDVVRSYLQSDTAVALVDHHACWKEAGVTA